MMRTLIKNGTIVNEGRSFLGDLVVNGEQIEEIYEGKAPRGIYDQVIDASGCFVLPGVIDDHVHFREPGLTRKADIESESRAAAFGGVTSYFEMPNTNPQTTTLEALEDKFALGAQKSHVNYSFFFGATNDNVGSLIDWMFIVFRVLNSLWVPAQAICWWISMSLCNRYLLKPRNWDCL